MAGWARGWPEALKARAARYALQRWLGPFLEEPLRLEQLGLDLRGGTGTVRDLRLRAPALDELLAGAGAPLELLEGGLGAVTVSVTPRPPCCSRLCGCATPGCCGRSCPRPGRRCPPPCWPPSCRVSRSCGCA
ncbi:autophagy-related protein 2 homolog A-like [Passer montanus]|uniref:autophagy-related protein 2 homolog A-like n=1 Tax=Passer montanus TaxID=9160 RepID=UPI00195FB788|nr:autophagy-related protein 2 homolog A-like [Passer montanus]XP_039580857.1 autophagy-related protein 2 homolog A-like [Passer montanus]